MNCFVKGVLLCSLAMIMMCFFTIKYYSSSLKPILITEPSTEMDYNNESLINSLTDIYKELNKSSVFNSSSFHRASLSKSSSSSSFSASSSLSSSSSSPVSRYIRLDLDYSRIFKRLWPKDQLCSKYIVRFGLDMSGGWLLSFPRSGNTWTRYLLEASTGVFTGSVYNSKYLVSQGYLGESDPVHRRSTIVTKTHSVQHLLSYSNRPVVTIIRNPARAILSYWNYKNIEDKKKKTTASLHKAFYQTAGFHLFFKEKLKKWMWTYSSALVNASRIHVVFYEKLRDNPLKELRGILKFLEVKPDKNRLFCLFRHIEGPAKGAQRNDYPYTRGEKNSISQAVENINVLLTNRGLSTLPDYSHYDT